MPAFPITTECYANRLAVLQALLQDTLSHRNGPECTQELEACFEQEARRLHAAIWAMQAEVEQD